MEQSAEDKKPMRKMMLCGGCVRGYKVPASAYADR